MPAWATGAGGKLGNAGIVLRRVTHIDGLDDDDAAAARRRMDAVADTARRATSATDKRSGGSGEGSGVAAAGDGGGGGGGPLPLALRFTSLEQLEQHFQRDVNCISDDNPAVRSAALARIAAALFPAAAPGERAGTGFSDGGALLSECVRCGVCPSL